MTFLYCQGCRYIVKTDVTSFCCLPLRNWGRGGKMQAVFEGWRLLKRPCADLLQCSLPPLSSHSWMWNHSWVSKVSCHLKVALDVFWSLEWNNNFSAWFHCLRVITWWTIGLVKVIVYVTDDYMKKGRHVGSWLFHLKPPNHSGTHK